MPLLFQRPCALKTSRTQICSAIYQTTCLSYFRFPTIVSDTPPDLPILAFETLQHDFSGDTRSLKVANGLGHVYWHLPWTVNYIPSGSSCTNTRLKTPYVERMVHTEDNNIFTHYQSVEYTERKQSMPVPLGEMRTYATYIVSAK